MNNYKLTIQYDGGRYKGWQRLGDSEHTIQGKIEKTLTEIIGHKIEIIGSSRTDAGVHALAQIANFKVKEPLEESKMLKVLNKMLPQDIGVTEITLVDEPFHARFHAKDKTYVYKIWNETYSHPFMRKYSMHVEEKLDLNKMNKACQHFLGEHDFTAYSNAKSKKKSMKRQINSLRVKVDAGFCIITISGNGFLYNMVRKIVGTLVEVGIGEISADDIPKIIESQDRSQTGRLAEANGLHLEKVDF